MSQKVCQSVTHFFSPYNIETELLHGIDDGVSLYSHSPVISDVTGKSFATIVIKICHEIQIFSCHVQNQLILSEMMTFLKKELIYRFPYYSRGLHSWNVFSRKYKYCHFKLKIC